MSKPTTMKIDDIEYVRKDSISSHKNFDSEIKIAVLQRGWVYIGRFEMSGDMCKLHNAYCIRVWGTTDGLPELADGPTEKTILDKCNGVVEFHAFTIINTITVNEEAWKELL